MIDIEKVRRVLDCEERKLLTVPAGERVPRKQIRAAFKKVRDELTEKPAERRETAHYHEPRES